MAKRIDALTINPTTLRNSVFINGPAEYLCEVIAELIKAEPHFATVFGEDIDSYMRMDYGLRNFPAVRIYNKTYRKEFESWFINGDILMDIILPADLRREELQEFTDLLSSAMVQQFRRPTFFSAVEAKCPGLNELGKTVDVDKSLAFEWGDNQAPLTQIVLNFRIDLRQWDDYLEATDREKDTPFEETLEALTEMFGVIIGLDDVGATGATGVTIGIEQIIEE